MIRVTSSAAVLRHGGCLIIGGDGLWNISRKPLSFECLRRLTRSRPRGLTIEYTLIALMAAFAAFQVLLAVGAKAGSM
jgi:hypothetical protein